MPTAAAIPLFALSLAVTLVAAGVFANRLDHVGLRLGLPEALLGLLTALAADAPELSSAVIALATGAERVGVGVVIGSNLFNLAAMIGLSAVVAGGVALRREALALEGTVGLLVLVVVATLIADLIPAAAAVVLAALVLVPYLVVLGLGRRGRLPLPLPRRVTASLRRGLGETYRERHTDSIRSAVLLLVPALTTIVLGSYGMVKTALVLGDRWGISHAIIGTLVLAVLTSLPNAFTGVRLGLAGRGAALVSETLNSNTINLVGGVAIPALVVGLAPFSGVIRFDLLWLLGTTVLVLALLARRDGLVRAGAGAILLLYAVFVAVQIASA